MKLKRQIIISIILKFSCTICFAQVDKIDSFLKVLPTLNDTIRVDFLNQLAYEFTAINKKDSAEYYSNLAYKEAKRLNYIHGIAVSVCHRSEIARHFDNDFDKSEALGKESLRWYDRTGNKKGIDSLYYLLCTVAFAQSKFEEAIDYSKKRYEYANENELELMSSDLYIGGIYAKVGDYEKTLLIGQRAYDGALKAKNKIDISICLWYMAQLYELIEDYPNALRYFRKMWQIDDDEIYKFRIANDCDT